MLRSRQLPWRDRSNEEFQINESELARQPRLHRCDDSKKFILVLSSGPLWSVSINQARNCRRSSLGREKILVWWKTGFVQIFCICEAWIWNFTRFQIRKLRLRESKLKNFSLSYILFEGAKRSNFSQLSASFTLKVLIDWKSFSAIHTEIAVVNAFRDLPAGLMHPQQVCNEPLLAP